YFINNNVWVEVYFTGDVPLWWGEFDITVSLGQSKPNGIPNNKFCKICNLYPLEAPPKQPLSASESDKKRRHPDESDSTADESNALKRLKADWPEISLPINIDSTKGNDKHSTFQLSMAICRKLMSSADESPNSNSYDEYLPQVVDVICFLVDSINENISAERNVVEEKIP
uniref:Uncharacterized protein n=1 Tax=Romanomermis culicivorax TaxID=13658 RepID=A0A915LAV2_ROMCU